MCLNLFLSSLEVSIVSTALVSIANKLNNFEESSWIVASYLLTYTGESGPTPLFLFSMCKDVRSIGNRRTRELMVECVGFIIVWSKISDIWGRKSCLTAAMLIFIIFSAACGASQTSAQL